MSMSLLYHAFGLRDHVYDATEYAGGVVSEVCWEKWTPKSE